MLQAAQGLTPAVAMGHQLGDHRIVEGGDLVARAQRMLDPQGASAGIGHLPGHHPAALRHEAGQGILGAQPYLDGMALEADVLLGQRQALTGRHPKLPVHQVQAGDGLGHRVFHLQPGVHLHEEEVTLGVEQKLQRARAFVSDGQRSLDGHCAHARTQRRTHCR